VVLCNYLAMCVYLFAVVWWRGWGAFLVCLLYFRVLYNLCADLSFCWYFVVMFALLGACYFCRALYLIVMFCVLHWYSISGALQGVFGRCLL